MKIKTHLTILLLLCFFKCISQSSGKIIYKISTIDFEIKREEGKNTGAKMLAQEVLEAASLQTFELSFGLNKSKFQNISTDTGINSELEVLNKLASVRFTCNFNYFFDKNKSQELFQYNDGTLVEKIYKAKNWNITKETKTIDKYICFKAIYSFDYLARDKKMKTRTITAWFAPSLPYPYGPKNYNGLPGLILELQDWNTTFLATKIQLIKKPIMINFPRGKTISEEEYEKAILKN